MAKTAEQREHEHHAHDVAHVVVWLAHDLQINVRRLGGGRATLDNGLAQVPLRHLHRRAVELHRVNAQIEAVPAPRVVEAELHGEVLLVEREVLHLKMFAARHEVPLIEHDGATVRRIHAIAVGGVERHAVDGVEER